MSMLFNSTKYKYKRDFIRGERIVKRLIVLAEFLILSLSLLFLSGIASQSFQIEGTVDSVQSECIDYDSLQKLIQIKCESVRLSDVHSILNNPAVLRSESDPEQEAKVWILNAGIEIEKYSSLIIDSNDTSWLKIIPTPTMQVKKAENITEDTNYTDDTLTVVKSINSTATIKTVSNTKIENGTVTVSKNNGDNPNGIHVHGALKIDSVKITSWDPEINDVIRFDLGKRPGEEHTKSDYDTAQPRAFIRVSKDATGTTDITNSEIAYLGYSCSRCAGLSYYGGEGSVIKDSNIHHLLKGFYSKNAGHLLIDGNKFHNNYLYGIDPHTGSHDLVIRNNLVYNNNASGIICSKDCYNLLIEGNTVYNNSGAGRGIAFSINTTNSIAKNNHVYDQPRCISFNRESNYNQVYNNTISQCRVGVYLSGTSENSIFGNSISNVASGISFKNFKNVIFGNNIFNASNGIAFTGGNLSADANNLTNAVYTQMHHENIGKIAENNTITGTEIPVRVKADSDKPTSNN
jgi:parallel beta-helix repeat protein